ncbi:unnamed protein product [Acanthoscelides obtectus]|uniref:Uncharacterized protein n=1 Tax=Acanthoscelides obtectus TaxID=200917 RepID=A0A9P0MBX3_ACAOB|nr:unnamed protein product [Acanthoscelides obtectus]CAK1645600.1 hypothetical protein AOBTE_LOCUS14162 [Acanthoscelides obtectus]
MTVKLHCNNSPDCKIQPFLNKYHIKQQLLKAVRHKNVYNNCRKLSLLIFNVTKNKHSPKILRTYMEIPQWTTMFCQCFALTSAILLVSHSSRNEVALRLFHQC